MLVSSVLAGCAGLILIFAVLWDGFETIVLPQRVVNKLSLARLFYRLVWAPWSTAARSMHDTNRRENFLSYFGPLSQIMLLGLWATGLITGFALLQWAIGSQFSTPTGVATFTSDLYVSGSTFFTLGISNVVPRAALARLLATMEGGVGFGFLAMVISYLPAMNGAFSRRMVLDLSTLALVGIKGVHTWQAQLTFAMAPHTAVDLSQVLAVPQCLPGEERLAHNHLMRLREELSISGAFLRQDAEANRRLNELCALSRHLLMELPPWVPDSSRRDNWQTTAWETQGRELP
jgi:Ion channel